MSATASHRVCPIQYFPVNGLLKVALLDKWSSFADRPGYISKALDQLRAAWCCSVDLDLIMCIDSSQSLTKRRQSMPAQTCGLQEWGKYVEVCRDGQAAVQCRWYCDEEFVQEEVEGCFN